MNKECRKCLYVHIVAVAVLAALVAFVCSQE